MGIIKKLIATLNDGKNKLFKGEKIMEFKRVISNVKTEEVGKDTQAKSASNFNDVTGQVFGDYKVIERVGKDGTGHALWKCRCIYCGDEFITTSYELKSGRKNTTCSCNHEKDVAQNKEDKNENVNTKKNNEAEDEETECLTCPANTICPDSPYYEDDSECTGECEKCPMEDICSDDDLEDEDEDYYGVTFTHEIGDFTEVPVNHVIAYCLGTDLSMNTNTARKLDEMYDIHGFFAQTPGPDWCDVALIRNLAIMFPTTYNKRVVSTAALRVCVRELAQCCAENNVKHLDMPHICCGRNKMDWEVVEEIIKEEFEDVYCMTGGFITVTFYSK